MGRGNVALGDGNEACEPRLGGQQIVTTRVEAVIGNAVADREELAASGSKRKPNSIASNIVFVCAMSVERRRASASEAAAERERLSISASIRIRALLCAAAIGSPSASRRVMSSCMAVSAAVGRVAQRREREKKGLDRRQTNSCSEVVARFEGSFPKISCAQGNTMSSRSRARLSMRRAHGLGPGDQLCIGAVAPFRSQRARNVRHGLSAGLELSQARDPIRWSDGRPDLERRGQSASSASSSCFRVTVWVRRSSVIARASVTEKQDGVGDSREHLRAEQRAVDDLLARLSERDEVTGEVSTIDRGYVLGIKRTEITRIIPVIEVTAETLEAVHRVERGFEPLDGRHRADPAEIVRGDDGEQIESDVGRRGAVGHDRRRHFLKIVGRKGVVLPGRRRSRRTARSGARSSAACAHHLAKEAEPRPRCGGRLIQCATAGDSAQRSANGVATSQAPGGPNGTRMAHQRARAPPPRPSGDRRCRE